MLVEQLKKIFGFDRFKNGQEAVIKKILEQRSVAAIFPTGGGKSMCYQLPAVLMPHLTLVVSPLLSLMKDQVEFLRSKNIAAASLDSTLSFEEYKEVIEKARNGELKILLISPERFKNERFRNHLSQMKISLMVIDEAHCISEWGHNFRPDYLKLPLFRKEFDIPQVLLLTATATPRVVKDMEEKFDIDTNDVVRTGFFRPNLHLQVIPITEEQKNIYLLQSLQQASGAPTIIYVTLQKTAGEVAGYLTTNGIPATPYHAGLKNEDRIAIQDRFMAGEDQVIVATIAFGMGVDKRDIRRVIHYDLPKSIENYSQEIGRAGRDGNISRCEVLANKDHMTILENFVYGDTPEKSAIEKLLKGLKEALEKTWEVKLYTLSGQLDIRVAPLKTLLVYLELEGIIQPKYTKFEDYCFKFIRTQEEILSEFAGERGDFIQTLFRHCKTKRVWTDVDFQGVMAEYQAPRDRIVKALDYFDEKGWIELKATSSVDVFEIINNSFDTEILLDKIYQKFGNKEKSEIRRIEYLIRLFESDKCLSRNLSLYFGDNQVPEQCGTCSVCQKGKATLQYSKNLKPLSEYNLNELIYDYRITEGAVMSPLQVARYFCGMTSPKFTRLRISRLPSFGILRDYHFKEVMNWVKKNDHFILSSPEVL